MSCFVTREIARHQLTEHGATLPQINAALAATEPRLTVADIPLFDIDVVRAKLDLPHVIDATGEEPTPSTLTHIAAACDCTRGEMLDILDSAALAPVGTQGNDFLFGEDAQEFLLDMVRRGAL